MKGVCGRVWLALACLGPTVAYGLAEDDILFYAPLDGTADAALARGEARAHTLAPPRFAEGKIGQGFLSGTANSRLAYPTRGNIDPDAGSVLLWVKPIKWYQKDAFMRFWFRIGEEPGAGGKGSGSFLWLYKYLSQTPLYWLVNQEYRQYAYAAVGADDVYRDGQWTHIAATWCGPVMRLYVNGEHQGTSRTRTPRLLRVFGPHFEIGGDSWTTDGITPKEPDSVIDEVYVLRRPATAAEVRAVIEKGRAAFGSTPDRPSLEIEAAYFPSTETLQVRAMVNGRRPGQTQGLSTAFTIENVETARPTAIDAVTRPVEAVYTEQALDLSKLGPGKYRVVAALVDQGRPCSLMSADFDKPSRPEWLGNSLGIPDTVPAPWTAIQHEGLRLTCWGRVVEYGPSLFPVQMTSQGRPLLARPVRLCGPTAAVEGASLRWGAVTPLRAEFTAEGRLGDLPVKADGWMEFDGLIWTTLTIPAQAGRTLEGLRLEVPLRPDVATLQHGCLERTQPANGRVSSWSHRILGQPFVWLGDEEVGLQWCTGDDYDWENRDLQRQVELKVSPNEVTLIANLVDHPVALDRPLVFTFGLHPTPVRPLPPRWRRFEAGMNGWWREAAGRGKPAEPVWAFWYQRWNLQNEAARKDGWLPGYQAPGPWTRELIAKTVAEGARPFLYWHAQAVWRGAPEYRGFRSEWHPDNPPPLPPETTGAKFGYANRTVRSFHDWIIWRYWKTFTDNPWLAEATAGLYNDVVQGFFGVAPRPDREGLIRTRHEVLGVRELQKRLYVMLQKHWPHLLLANHQSGDSHLAQLAFAHMYITGENYRGHARLGQDQGYYHVMDLDSCRAELLSAHWGVPIIFLPETTSSGVSLEQAMSPAGLKSSEHLVGLLLVHDVIPWSTLTNPIPLIRLAALKEAFGWDEQTEFIGYWKTQDLVRLQADQSPVVVSVYRRPGRALLAAMNNSDADATVTLEPNWAKLGLSPPTELVDAYTATGIGEAPLDMKLLNEGKFRLIEPAKPFPTLRLPVEGGRVRFTVPKRNFRALLVQG